ncbi:MAG: 5'-deoxyadenosine deaminase [Calditrichaceae bacterium]
MSQKILIKNALIVTMNPESEILTGDILVEDRRIIRIAKNIDEPCHEVFNAENLAVVPGFIQTHIHLCQVLFRNMADDLRLLDWLQKKIWPFEAGHTPESLELSARLGIAELIKSGTTTILDMGTVNHQDMIFRALAESGLRAFAGKAMMDYGNLPEKLKEETAWSIDESLRLLKKWHLFDDGRLQYAFAPRFALSCSDDLLTETGRLSREYDVLYHTHASENIDEVNLVRERFGVSNIQLFEKLGVADEKLCLAHCIWTDKDERALLKEKNIKVLHCPSANLKLASGIAPIPDYLADGITVSLGADGAPCNNNLDIFNEMRLAALIQKPKYGPASMPAFEVFKMATINGAKTLGMQNTIGSIEEGKKADLSFIDLNQVHSVPYEDIYSKMVYSSKAEDVKHVMTDGKWLMKNRELLTLNELEIIHSVNSYAAVL